LPFEEPLRNPRQATYETAVNVLGKNAIVFGSGSNILDYCLFNVGNVYNNFLDYRDWCDVHGKDMLNPKIEVMTVQEVRTFLKRGKKGKWFFVKPLIQHKAFNGNTYNADSFSRAAMDRDKNRLCVVAPAHNAYINPLHRSALVGDRLYVSTNLHAYHPKAVDFLKKIALATPAECISIDIVEHGGHLKLNEYNPVAGGGFPVGLAMDYHLKHHGKTIQQIKKEREAFDGERGMNGYYWVPVPEKWKRRTHIEVVAI